MDSETMAAIAAAACFLVAALACSRSEEAGIWLGIAGATFLAASLVARGWKERVWPLSTSYEFSLAFALGTALFSLFVGRKRERLVPSPQISSIRAAAMAMAASLIIYARLGIPAASRDVQPLSLAPNSLLCMLHVGTAAMGYGALAVAGLAGAVCLRQESGPGGAGPSGKEVAAGTSEGQDALWMLDRTMLLGYPLLTLSLLLRIYCIRGALWAWTSWTSPWSSNPRGIALLLTWVLYAAYWPLRRRAKRRIRSTAWLAVIGLGCLLFTFIGVSWLVRWTGAQSQHLF